MLPQSKLLQLAESISLSSTVNDCILQDISIYTSMVNRALGLAFALVVGRLKLIRIAPLAVNEARVVITLVEKLEDGAEDLGLFIRKGNLLGDGVHVSVTQGRSEEGRRGEDVLMGSKESLLGADD